MMKNYTLLFVILFLNSCMLNNEKSNLSKLLFEEIHNKKIDLIIVVTEIDCNSCIEKLLKDNTSISDNVTGLYYSKSSDNLKNRLEKEYSQINWMLLNNVDILSSIKKMNDDYYSGPYFFDFVDGKYTQRQ